MTDDVFVSGLFVRNWAAEEALHAGVRHGG
jgi:hypothetical protein